MNLRNLIWSVVLPCSCNPIKWWWHVVRFDHVHYNVTSRFWMFEIVPKLSMYISAARQCTVLTIIMTRPNNWVVRREVHRRDHREMIANVIVQISNWLHISNRLAKGPSMKSNANEVRSEYAARSYSCSNGLVLKTKAERLISHDRLREIKKDEEKDEPEISHKIWYV